uniref:Uncharacterized protein n=1 Tax=Quercus lobata TaxID=97700 RepID=A0A7N2L9N7_QUELO
MLIPRDAALPLLSLGAVAPPLPPPPDPSGPPRFEGGSKFGDHDGYRGGPRGPPGEFGGEKGGAPLDFQPSYRSGRTVYYFELSVFCKFWWMLGIQLLHQI